MNYDEKYITESYLSGKSQKELATELGTYNTSIRRILLRNGVIPRTSYEAQERYVTDNFLLNNHYWLGMLAADGCVMGNTTVVLQLQKKDSQLLEEFCIASKSKKLKVNSYNNSTYNIKEYYVKFKNKEIVEYLYSLGIVKKKSLIFNYKGEINWEFFRGYFDGDGSIGLYGKNKTQGRITIVSGSPYILPKLQTFLAEHNIYSNVTSSIYHNRNILYCLSIHRQEDIFKCYNYMYNTSNSFLKRKKNKFGSIVKKFTKENAAKTGKSKLPDNPVLADNLGL
jgi:hypothetical protein